MTEPQVSRRGKRESDIVRSVRKMVDDADMQTSLIRNRWRENYDMFVYGTRNEEKEDWQTNFSVNKFQTSMRTAQGRLVNILVNTPDWFEVCPKGYSNRQAEVLAPCFQKMMEYYLDAAKFKRHAGTFFLCSLISQGILHVGWQQRLIQNPEYIMRKTEKEREAEQKRLAKNVTNPMVSPELSGDEMEKKLIEALDSFVAEAQGETAIKVEPKPYVQIGCLDFKDVNHEKFFWDPNVMYMEESSWKAFRYTVNKWELNYFAKLGYFSKAKVQKVGSQRDLDTKLGTQQLRYQNTIDAARSRSDLVELLVYYGPLVIDEEVVKDRYFCIIGNDDVLLKEGEYPYWEPPGHLTPIVATAVRQIPYRATGAGIGDNATQLQKVYDSNWQLVCDTFRFGIAGINIVNYQNLVDKSQLLEGIYPGMTLEVRGAPKDSFEHLDLTSNLENQAHPVQTMLENAIDQLTGINEMMTGGSNPYSRTPATETNARLDAGTQNVNIIALDLEQNFLIPTLEKVLARILQFGLTELTSNPELQALFDEEEMNELLQLNAQSRYEILNQWFKFKIKGFSSDLNKDEAAQRDNELLAIVNSGGPLAQLINLPAFMKQYFKNRDIKDPDRLLLSDSPLVIVTAETQALMSGHMVIPSPMDDHEFHMQMQGPLAQSPYSTPEMQQHLMMHQQAVMQMQAMQAESQNGGPPSRNGGPPQQEMQ